jgi:hypothetical protein
MGQRTKFSVTAAAVLLLGWVSLPAVSQYPNGPVRRPGIPAPPTGTTPGGTQTTPGGANNAAARGFVPPGIDLVAGVRLDKPAEMPPGMNDIRAVAYDAKAKRLFLIGESNRKLPNFRLDDLAVALKVPGDGFPGVSIEGPIQDGRMTVRYYGGTENTHFGQVMFEADRLLKSLSMGRDNVTKEILRPRVRGYESELRRFQSMGGAQRPKAWHRYWFRPALISMTESDDGQAMRFDNVKIEVKTEYVPPIPEEESEPAAEAFAQHFTEHFDEFAAQYPVFAELRELAKVAALAQWIKENGIPVESLNPDAAVIPEAETPKTTPIGYNQAFSLLPEGLWKHQMEGGVTFRLWSAPAQPGDAAPSGNWVVNRNKGTAITLLKTVLKNPSDDSRKWFGAYQPASVPTTSGEASYR